MQLHPADYVDAMCNPTFMSNPTFMQCCLRAEGSGTATLDFSNTVAALLLVQESQLTLRDLRLMQLAPVTAGYSSGSYVSNMSLLWPSINAAPGTQVNFAYHRVPISNSTPERSRSAAVDPALDAALTIESFI